MIWIVFGVSIIHSAVFLFLIFRFNLLKNSKSDGGHSFSILVPVRNESEHLNDLMDCFGSLEFPADRFEVLVIDDHCEDETIRNCRLNGIVKDVRVTEKTSIGHTVR